MAPPVDEESLSLKSDGRASGDSSNVYPSIESRARKPSAGNLFGYLDIVDAPYAVAFLGCSLLLLLRELLIFAGPLLYVHLTVLTPFAFVTFALAFALGIPVVLAFLALARQWSSPGCLRIFFVIVIVCWGLSVFSVMRPAPSIVDALPHNSTFADHSSFSSEPPFSSSASSSSTAVEDDPFSSSFWDSPPSPDSDPLSSSSPSSSNTSSSTSSHALSIARAMLRSLVTSIAQNPGVQLFDHFIGLSARVSNLRSVALFAVSLYILTSAKHGHFALVSRIVSLACVTLRRCAIHLSLLPLAPSFLALAIVTFIASILIQVAVTCLVYEVTASLTSHMAAFASSFTGSGTPLPPLPPPPPPVPEAGLCHAWEGAFSLASPLSPLRLLSAATIAWLLLQLSALIQAAVAAAVTRLLGPALAPLEGLAPLCPPRASAVSAGPAGPSTLGPSAAPPSKSDASGGASIAIGIPAGSSPPLAVPSGTAVVSFRTASTVTVVGSGGIHYSSLSLPSACGAEAGAPTQGPAPYFPPPYLAPGVSPWAVLRDSLTHACSTVLGTTCGASLLLAAAAFSAALVKLLSAYLFGVTLFAELLAFPVELAVFALSAFVCWLVIPIAVTTGKDLRESVAAGVQLLRKRAFLAVMLNLVTTSLATMVMIVTFVAVLLLALVLMALLLPFMIGASSSPSSADSPPTMGSSTTGMMGGSVSSAGTMSSSMAAEGVLGDATGGAGPHGPDPLVVASVAIPFVALLLGLSAAVLAAVRLLTTAVATCFVRLEAEGRLEEEEVQ